MPSQLTPCPSCSRHVKVGPPSCPFCGGAVPVDVPARVVAAGRPLSRAALLFAGAAAVTACSSSTTSPTPPKDAEVDTGHAVAAYGVAITDSGEPGNDASGEPDGGAVAAYGVFVDGGLQHAADGGSEPDGGAVAAYGVFVNDASLEPDAGQGGAAYGVFVNPDGGS